MANEKMKRYVDQIFGDMNKIAGFYEDYAAKAAQNQRSYIGDTLEREQELAESYFYSNVYSWLNSIDLALDSLEAAADETYSFKPASASDILATAELLKHPGIDRKTLEGIVAAYIGNFSALNLIEANAHEEYKPMLKKLCIDVKDAFGQMHSIVGRIDTTLKFSKTPTAVFNLANLREALLDFCRKTGIDFDEPELANLDALRARNISNMMGIH